MGKSLIITESEKKQILSLYETAPPPSESVLVTNKNPFKYPEYESARRVYSPDLKNGDMFYIFYNVKYENKLQDDVYPKLIKKNIRVDDTIYYIVEVKVSFDNITVYLDINANSNFHRITLKVSKDDVYFHYMSRSESYRKSMELSILPKLDKLIENIRIILQEVSNKIELYKKNIKLVPDEYFEIRKIQRQQTDF